VNFSGRDAGTFNRAGAYHGGVAWQDSVSGIRVHLMRRQAADSRNTTVRHHAKVCGLTHPGEAPWVCVCCTSGTKSRCEGGSLGEWSGRNGGRGEAWQAWLLTGQ